MRELKALEPNVPVVKASAVKAPDPSGPDAPPLARTSPPLSLKHCGACLRRAEGSGALAGSRGAGEGLRGARLQGD